MNGQNNQGDAIHRLRSQLEDALVVLARSLAADVITLFLYDAEADEFDLPVSHGLRYPQVFADSGMRPGTDRATGRIVKQRKPLIPFPVNSASLLSASFEKREGIVRVAGFPLVAGDQPMGVVFVSYRQEHAFTREDRQTVENWTSEVAQVISRANVFRELQLLRAQASQRWTRHLQSVCQLGSQITNRPVVIWLADDEAGALRIKAMTGLACSELTTGAASLGDGSLTVQELGVGTEKRIPDIQQCSHLPYRSQALLDGWCSVLRLPILVQEKNMGIIDVLGASKDDLSTLDRAALHRLTDVAGTVIENANRARKSERLARVAQELGGIPDLERAMQMIVDNARELTGGDMSVIFLFDQRTKKFLLGSRSPTTTGPDPREPRLTGGLTRNIIDTGRSIRIDDAELDGRVQPEAVAVGIRSLIGTRVQRGQDRVGVLYVLGYHTNQFNNEDIQVVETLANHVSVALGWTHRLLEITDDVENAATALFGLDPMLEELSDAIRRDMGFDYVAVQLIRPDERTIETVWGCGISKDLPGIAKHSLDAEPELRDIQADIAMSEPPRIEVISGQDRRFDSWIYEKFHHEKLIRAWVPMLVVYEESGRVVDDWFDHCDWEVSSHESNGMGWRIACELRLDERYYPKGSAPIVYVIGTVEAGFEDPAKIIKAEDAERLARIVSTHTLRVRHALLLSVLETIAKSARRMLDADSASLHFAYNPDRERYAYEVFSGEAGHRFLQRAAPEHHGLGREAIKHGEAKFLPDPAKGWVQPAVEDLFPGLKGIRAMAAFPLLVDDEKSVLYVYFERAHRFTEDEIGWVNMFVKRAADAIRHVTRRLQTRDQLRQLTYLQAVARSLGNPMEPLLRDIAWYATNVLAAAVVTIHEYIEPEQRFSDTMELAGRLKSSRFPEGLSNSTSLAARLIEYGKDVYEDNVHDNRVPCDSSAESENAFDQFLATEGISTFAGFLLRVGDEIVGVMCVHYRSPHRFASEDKDLVRVLAHSAAIAIKTARSYRSVRRDLERHNEELQALGAVGRAMVSREVKLDKTLSLILDKALEITHAASGYIMWSALSRCHGFGLTLLE